MSTFNCLGFHLENEQGFRILIERALRFGRIVWPPSATRETDTEVSDPEEDDADAAAPTHCVLWTVPGGSGIEVWVLRDDDENVVGCNPHLRSKLECPAHIVPETDGIALVSCENFRVQAEIPNVPFALEPETKVNLSMFVRELSACDPQEHVTFTQEPGEDALLVRFTGPLESVVLATNQDTETQFGTATLALSAAAKLALAVDLKRTKEMPGEGWVTGTGYLSAALPIA